MKGMGRSVDAQWGLTWVMHILFKDALAIADGCQKEKSVRNVSRQFRFSILAVLMSLYRSYEFSILVQ